MRTWLTTASCAPPSTLLPGRGQLPRHPCLSLLSSPAPTLLPRHPRPSPLSSPAPTLLPFSYTSSGTLTLSPCSCLTDTHARLMALTPWAPSFSTSPATHTLMDWFPPRCTVPHPESFLASPTLSHFPGPFLPLSPPPTLPSPANESPTLALAPWHWPKPGTSVPTGP